MPTGRTLVDGATAMRRAQRCAVERFADRGFDAVTVEEISRRLPTAPRLEAIRDGCDRAYPPDPPFFSIDGVTGSKT